MKILFLDIDGVLNHRKSPTTNGVFVIDEQLLPLLKRIVDETGVKIVLSSSWRLSIHSRLRVKDALKTIGTRFIDYTKFISGPRSEEIKEWLERHPKVTSFAILDDDFDAKIDGHFFQTDFNNGLTPEITEKVIKYLNKE